MYVPFVVVVMGVIPLLAVVVEYVAYPGPGLVVLVGKWFVFWAVGVRLAFSGLHQALNPSFTAGNIFATDSPEADRLVVEIGYGNIAIGVPALLSLFFPAWVLPAGVAGMIFYLLAGVRHVLNGGRSANETVAMVSDLAIGLLLVVYVLLSVI